jgi:hypothetical protein
MLLLKLFLKYFVYKSEEYFMPAMFGFCILKSV